MNGLKENNIELDRKVLAHVAMHDPGAFKELVQQVSK
jgi:ribosomal protein L20